MIPGRSGLPHKTLPRVLRQECTPSRGSLPIELALSFGGAVQQDGSSPVRWRPGSVCSTPGYGIPVRPQVTVVVRQRGMTQVFSVRMEEQAIPCEGSPLYRRSAVPRGYLTAIFLLEEVLPM